MLMYLQKRSSVQPEKSPRTRIAGSPWISTWSGLQLWASSSNDYDTDERSYRAIEYIRNQRSSWYIASAVRFLCCLSMSEREIDSTLNPGRAQLEHGGIPPRTYWHWTKNERVQTYEILTAYKFRG